MIVKIKTSEAEHIYTSDEVFILVDLTDDEKHTFLEMGDQNKVVSYPDGISDESIEQWMHS